MQTNGIVNGNKIIPRVTAIIQARMQSKRLPGKAMLDLGGKPLLYHVIERAQLIEGVDTVVVAVPWEEGNFPLIDLAKSMNAEVFTGSMENVLERFYFACMEFQGDYYLRITGDNPFIDIDYASMVLDISIESSSDLCALSNLPLGTAVEVIKKRAIEKSFHFAEKAYHREHVTTYIKEHPELFKIERPSANIFNVIENLRLTVDTPDDYKLASLLYDNLYFDKPFSLSDVINYLKENPDLVNINNGIKQRPATHAESAPVK